MRDLIAFDTDQLAPKNLKKQAPSHQGLATCARAKVRQATEYLMIHPYRAMLKQVLEGRLSANAIANQRNMSHHTVRRAQKIAAREGLTSDKLEAMSDSIIREMFGASRLTDAGVIEPDLAADHVQLRKGYNRLETYARYAEQVGQENALAYRTYCKRMEEYIGTLDPVMSLDHAPGYALQTDYAGYQPLARDTNNCAPIKFKLFVAVLPFSRYIAAEIVRSEKTADHIHAVVSALDQIGGAPVILVPDNLKAAVIRRPRFGPPVIQTDYQALADHYGMGVVPARPLRPQDKSGVENGVKLIQRHLRLRFLDRPVPLLADLRSALREIVADWNRRTLRRANGHSRQSLFESEERGYLRPLPQEPYRPVELRRPAVVGRDYHVPFKGNFYSVPHGMIGQKVTVLADVKTVRILHDAEQVALHPRLYGAGARNTHRDHQPDEQRKYAEVDLVLWARDYGSAVQQLAAIEMTNELNLQLRKQRSRWVRDIPRMHGRKRFEAACVRAIAANDYRFEHVFNALQRGIESAPLETRIHEPISATSNVRGPEYYNQQDDDI